MKIIKFFSITIIALIFSISAIAQRPNQHQKSNVKTESFKVAGRCDICRAQIEKAVKVEGVTKAEWDDKKQLLTVTYIPSMVKIDDLQKKIAAVGHDTEKYKADDETYYKLPICCQYKRLKQFFKTIYKLLRYPINNQICNTNQGNEV